MTAGFEAGYAAGIRAYDRALLVADSPGPARSIAVPIAGGRAWRAGLREGFLARGRARAYSPPRGLIALLRAWVGRRDAP